MKENIFKCTLTTVSVALSLYFEKLMIPILVLALVMVVDYITGLISARMENKINSRVGALGVVKKACYLLLVGVGMGADWLVSAVATHFNINIGVTMLFGLIVAIWLVINELISILENLTKIGVPMPQFLTKLFGKLKTAVENQAENKTEKIGKKEEK